MSALIDKIQQYAIEEDGCWRWTARCVKNVTPTMWWDGKSQSVRRLILEERGTPIKGFVATAICGNPRCVNPEHVVRINRKNLATQAAANMDAATRLGRRLKNAEQARKKSTLTMELVQAIKNDGRPRAAIAAAYGIGEGAVAGIQYGKTWREFVAANNPFAQLMRI